jgi:branched-chain amino acid transport system ATP-binding protein
MMLLETKSLTKEFSDFRAIDCLNLSLMQGERRAIIGPNGAGKTTLLRLLSGELQPSRGELYYENRKISGWPAHAIARRGIARTFQIVNLFPNLTIEETLRAAAQVSDSWLRWSSTTQNRAREILEKINLTEKIHQRVGELSHGDQRLVEIGVALTQQPKLLLLDEPTAGLSPVETRAMTELIGHLSNITLVIVEHDMDVVLALAKKITVLHRGQILAEGTPAEIQADRQVQEVYLRRASLTHTEN